MTDDLQAKLDAAQTYAVHCEQQWEDAKDRGIGLKYQNQKLRDALQKIIATRSAATVRRIAQAALDEPELE